VHEAIERERELIAVLEQRLSEKRLAHVLGCAETACVLAEKTGESVQSAARAALLHDITRELSLPEQLKICEKYGIIIDSLEAGSVALLHSHTGAAVAEAEFAATPEIVRAIRLHTTGDRDMTRLDRILCLADYIEPTRAFPGVDALREAAAEDPDRALWQALCGTVAHLESKQMPVHPRTRSAADALAQTLSV